MASRRFVASLIAIIAGGSFIAVSPPAANAAPTLAWTKSVAGGTFGESSPMATNLDGHNDIVVGNRNGNLYAIHPDGTDVGGFPKPLGDGIDSSPSAADTNGDGQQELFTGTGTGAARSGAIVSLTNTGAERWRFKPRDNDFPNLAVFSSPALADVNGDGVTDVSAFTLGLQGWSMSENGSENKGWPFYQDDTVFSSPAIADVDGDGKSDYVVGGDSSPGGPVDIRGGVLRAIRGNGSLIWQHAFDEMIRSSPSIGDIDGDGKLDIVVGTGDYWTRQPGGSADSNRIYAFNMDGSIKWVKDIGGQTMASPTLADTDGDGILDVVEPTWGSTNGGKVFIFNGSDGSFKAGWAGHDSGGGAVLAQVSTADINADGAQDVIVPTGGGVYAYDGRSGAQLFGVQQGIASYQSTPLVTDLDGGGTLALVVAGTKPDGTGVVSRYNLPGAVLGARGWPQFRKDNRRTGSWQNTSLRTDFCTPNPGDGYWLTAGDGGLFGYCGAPFYGAAASYHPNKPVVGMAKTPANNGYWQVASDGGIFSFGAAGFYGSTGNIRLNQPIVGMATTPSGHGYWLVASDGGIFAYGDAAFYGSTGNIRLNQPIVGMATTPSGHGYWLVASDGGIFAYGDATFRGSTGNIKLNQPVVGMTATASGSGYWLVASDGGIFAFGAPFYGSTGNIRLNEPIVGISRNRSGSGYRMVARDGGIFAYNSAFLGSTGAIKINQPIVNMAS